jgi:hypothetical protein
MPFKDPEKYKAWAREYSKKYRREHFNKRKAIEERYRAGRLKEIWLIKGERGCIDCGIKDPRVLDFDHVMGKKEFTLGNGPFYSKERVLKEIKKCVVRCANCHRIKTYERREGSWIKRMEDKHESNNSVEPPSSVEGACEAI